MEEAQKHLEEAIADSSASDYDKGNILYLAENLAEVSKKSVAKEILDVMEANNDPWRNHTDIVRNFAKPTN
jgi:hypothetical protein